MSPLFCHYLLFISSYFGVSGRLCFLILTFFGNLYAPAKGGRAYSIYPVCMYVCMYVYMYVRVCVCVCYQNRVRSITLVLLDAL